ncbi:MAG: thiamine pyrophosphate-dependent enzyme [Actinomycetota bacterium]|nr:thiamine pyrophosphate-dependent enzyme [Actinomycetota bacterium]
MPPRQPDELLDDHFREALGALRDRPSPPVADLDRPVREGSGLTGRHALELFEAMAASRHLDLAARYLRRDGPGLYTIGSAGHEANAAVAAAAQPTDPALLHYRSGGFYCARGQQVPGSTPLRDVLLGLVAAVDEPIAGGRHKVFGNAKLNVIPQTSTIASHLPRAVGVGFGIERARKLGVSPWPSDAIALCSFGDASVNHSTAVGALNSAEHTVHQGLPVPVLFCCEDNGLGISVRTPAGWVETAWSRRPHLRYFSADGTDLAATYDAALEAVEYVRRTRRPAFFHLRCVRFLGHAGTDAEIGYRSEADVATDLARDPLVAAAKQLVEAGVADAQQLLDRYESVREEVHLLSEEVARHAQLSSAEEVMATIAPRRHERIAAEAARSADPETRKRVFGGRLPEDAGPLTLADSINRTLADSLAVRPEMIVFGEDVGRKGGVYGLTRGLQRQFGPGRVFDTLLDEQTILGAALGSGVSGLLPVPEIQYLAYLHNAEDQLRGEAATLSFFSTGQYRNPMVVRVAGYGYQKGFGGHFHNDDAVAVLRDIPGLVIASPSRPDDAAAMMRTCLAAAASDGAVCVFLEPIALYHTRDLHEDGDRDWLAEYAPAEDWDDGHVPLESARVHGSGDDLTLVTFGNGTYMSLRVQRRLAEDGVDARVLDIRWLAPLPIADVVREAEATGRVLIVDETRRSGGVGEGLVTSLVDAGFDGALARVSSKDSFVPLGGAANLVLLSESEIEAAARELVSRDRPSRLGAAEPLSIAKTGR